MKITSIQNKHIKELVKLKTKKERDSKNLFLIEGDHLIKEALKDNLVVETLTYSENLKADTYITKEIMQKLSNQKSVSEILAVCQKIKEKKIGNKILALDGVQDPGNLGTIIRSAVAFNFTDIILSQDTVDLYNDKVIRSSEGMIFKINIIRTNLEDFLEKNKNEYQILITDVKDGKNIKDISLNNKIILIIGNEGMGIKNNIKKFKNKVIKINMNKNCESLNVGVSASILMYEVDKHE